jgi:predicted dehydrogenase
MMDKVRMGVIGTGGMGRGHMSYFHEVDGLQLTAGADIDPQICKQVAEQFDIPTFATGEELLDSGLVDAVLIATPHYFHPPLATEAFRRGIHVLSEKPIGVDKKSVLAMKAEYEKTKDLVFSIMFQSRTVPKFVKLREMIQNGDLGEIKRVNWIITAWYRPQVYYDSGTWRATWQGEGGGVLINQCPHNLDIWQWLFGLPRRVTTHLGLGRYHDIEVEDDVTTYMEYDNGASALFITSTGDCPGTDRMEVTGDCGKVVIEGGSFVFNHSRVPTSEHIRSSKASFERPALETMTIEPAHIPGGGSHKTITQNFVNTILGREELIVHALEGLACLELVNAQHLSGLRHKTVELPIDADEFDGLLQELKASSRVKTEAADAIVDMEASYHK